MFDVPRPLLVFLRFGYLLTPLHQQSIEQAHVSKLLNANQAYANGEYASSYQLLQELLQELPNGTPVEIKLPILSRLGELAEALGHDAHSYELCCQVLQLDANHASALAIMGRLLSRSSSQSQTALPATGQ